MMLFCVRVFLKTLKMTTEDFIQFWNSSNFYGDTKIHKEDYESLKNHLVEGCRNFNDYISNYIDNPQDTKFHSYLWPSPYCGDLRNAKIFILSLNPGFDCDYYYENISDIKKTLENNLSQNLSNEKFPFFVLNPAFSWTGGAKYWLKKLNPIICEVMKKLKFSYTKSLSFLSKKIVALEIVPYHSKRFSYSHFQELPSVKKISEFLNDVIIPGTKTGEYKLIILRKGKELQEKKLIPKTLNKNIIIYEGMKCLGASLGLKSDGGKAILKKLLQNLKE